MNGKKLEKGSFITIYEHTPISVEAYETDEKAKDQLELEGRLRRKIVPVFSPVLGEVEEKFIPYYSYGSSFVDVSKFYHTLKKISFFLRVRLESGSARKIDAVLWTYMGVGVYLGGKLIGENREPLYKPIRKIPLVLDLAKGENTLVFECVNLGARDTRNILGLEIVDDVEDLFELFPGEDTMQACSFLEGVGLSGDVISFPFKAGRGMSILFHRESPDFEVMRLPVERKSIDGLSSIKVPADISKATIFCTAEGAEISRTIEISVHEVPEHAGHGLGVKENFDRVMRMIAMVGSEDRGPFGFPPTNLLARKYSAIVNPNDRNYILDAIRVVNERVDCSDFVITGLLRYFQVYGFEDKEIEEKFREMLAGFRFWMDGKGSDGMCFWSENHSLMFYYCAMEAGRLYPDMYFSRMERVGSTMYEQARHKVVDWLDDVLEHGFEEFLSTVYMCVTLAVLLNLVDFGDEEISSKAEKVTDRLIAELSLHTFKGAIVAPMGRVYREALHPFRQGALSIVNLIDPESCSSYGEGWVAYLASSKYRFKDGLLALMKDDYIGEHDTGNATIKLEKNSDYLLTSVRTDLESRRWKNIRGCEDFDINRHECVKSLNEAFHGTSFFQGGTYGYQQHLWYAALDPEAVIFSNHPGCSSEKSDMRPGYWFGNGEMPCLRQEKGMLAAVYSIDDEHPIGFTHLYVPFDRFDSCRSQDGWIFLGKGTGELAVWASGKMVKRDDMIFDSELRLYARNAAYLVLAGKRGEEFERKVLSMKVFFDDGKKTLYVDGSSFLTFVHGTDRTQFVD